LIDWRFEVAWTRIGTMDSQLEGVYFGMTDGKSARRCFISGGTLDDWHGGYGPAGQEANVATFKQFEAEIEAIAARKLAASPSARLTQITKDDRG
jgi:hypothetical protein